MAAEEMIVSPGPEEHVVASEAFDALVVSGPDQNVATTCSPDQLHGCLSLRSTACSRERPSAPGFPRLSPEIA
jgi:hypothetical protein